MARWLGSEQAAHIRAERAKTLPARNDAVLPPGDTFLAAFAEQAKRSVPMSSSLAMDVVWEPSIKAIRKVLRRDALAPLALSEAKRRFDDVRRPLPPRSSTTPLMVVIGMLCLFGAFSLVRRARAPDFRHELKRSLPAYSYVVHAVLAIGILVLLPLFLGALTSLFAGRIEQFHYVGLTNFFQILTARGGLAPSVAHDLFDAR